MQHRPCDMVGAYSEALFAKPYDVQSVMRLLVSGHLNDKAADNSLTTRFRCLMGRYYRQDGLYAEQLWIELVKIGGWPPSAESSDVRPIAEILGVLGVSFDAAEYDDGF